MNANGQPTGMNIPPWMKQAMLAQHPQQGIPGIPQTIGGGGPQMPEELRVTPPPPPVKQNRVNPKKVGPGLYLSLKVL